MTFADLPLPLAQRGFLERFIAACAADARVLAALLGGSYARDHADAFSDLDLSILVTDEHYAMFLAERETLLGALGTLVFLESFDRPSMAFCIYADGVEVELCFASPSRRDQIETGRFRALYDPQGLLAGAHFSPALPTPEEQREALRRLISYFWHDMAHFITAMARGQHCWAYSQLEELRRSVMNLMRFRRDPLGELCGYEKIDQALPAEDLALFATTYTVLERDALLQAGRILAQCYQDLARPLAAATGLAYPVELEQIMLTRLTSLILARPR